MAGRETQPRDGEGLPATSQGWKLFGELDFVKYKFVNKVVDELEGHHIPSGAFMKNLKNNIKYTSDPLFKAAVDTYGEGLDAFTIMMEKTRHQKSLTYKRNSINPGYLSLSPLDALSLDIENLRDIYRANSIYTTDVANKINTFQTLVKNQYLDIFK
jgi:hypothetical protein